MSDELPYYLAIGDEVVRMLAATGFSVVAAASTLATPADLPPVIEHPRLEIDETCGFVCLLAECTARSPQQPSAVHAGVSCVMW